MPKSHVHLLLPTNDWTTPGFSWCLRLFATDPVGRQLPTTNILAHATCPKCRALFTAAQAELGHPLREYAQLDSLQQAVVLDSPASVAYYCRALVHAPQEQVMCLMATVKMRLVHSTLLFKGTLAECLFHPREIFRAVIEQNAYGFVLVHNHPSGEPEPSEDDTRVTRQLLRCSRLLQVPFLDHVIVARQGFYSLREQTSLWDKRFTEWA